MKPYLICFSPTGSSRRIAEAVVRGLAAINESPDTPETESTETPRIVSPQPEGNAAYEIIDLTYATPAERTLPHDALAVIAVPVYGGHVAPTARERLDRLRGTETPAVLIVLYGNRSFGGALTELAAYAVARGFRPVAAAACVGEHSYSSDRYPIAVGRPDSHDLSRAEEFGRRIGRRITDAARQNAEPAVVDVRRIARPGNGLLSTLRFIRFVLSYRRRQKRRPQRLLPATDPAACTHCGRCAARCPVGAIEAGTEERTDPTRCIRCCACVKECPVGARSFETPFAETLSRNFRRPKPCVFLPEE